MIGVESGRRMSLNVLKSLHPSIRAASISEIEIASKLFLKRSVVKMFAPAASQNGKYVHIRLM